MQVKSETTKGNGRCLRPPISSKTMTHSLPQGLSPPDVEDARCHQKNHQKCFFLHFSVSLLLQLYIPEQTHRYYVYFYSITIFYTVFHGYAIWTILSVLKSSCMEAQFLSARSLFLCRRSGHLYPPFSASVQAFGNRNAKRYIHVLRRIF